MKYLFVLISAICITVFVQCNNEQQLENSSWYFFEIDLEDERVYSEVTFGNDSIVCFHTENIQTCNDWKLEKKLLLRSYDFNLKEAIDTSEIISLSKNKLIIKNSENQELILKRLDFQSIDFMQTGAYDEAFEKRLIKQKLNNK